MTDDSVGPIRHTAERRGRNAQPVQAQLLERTQPSTTNAPSGTSACCGLSMPSIGEANTLESVPVGGCGDGPKPYSCKSMHTRRAGQTSLSKSSAVTPRDLVPWAMGAQGRRRLRASARAGPQRRGLRTRSAAAPPSSWGAYQAAQANPPRGAACASASRRVCKRRTEAVWQGALVAAAKARTCQRSYACVQGAQYNSQALLAHRGLRRR
jgi:hypothetical protein